MLYYETIEPELLELLNKLLDIEEFKELRLVGGTSLALQYGHRKSVDIDYFADAEQNPMPEMLNPVSWADIQHKIEQEVNAYLR
jgi:hypothetical protein